MKKVPTGRVHRKDRKVALLGVPRIERRLSKYRKDKLLLSLCIPPTDKMKESYIVMAPGLEREKSK